MPEAAAVSRDATDNGPRAGRIALAILLVAAVVMLAYLLSGRMRVSRWTVKAPSGIDAQALQAKLESGYSNVSFFALDIEKIEKELSSDPLVKSVRVNKVFPNAVSVELVERRAAMAVICESSGASRAALVDGEGVLFRIESGSVADNLPILSGVRFENPAPGAQLPDVLLPLVASVQALQESGSSLLGMVSELRFVSRPGGEGECLMYTMGSPIPVRLSDTITEETLKQAALVLDVMKKRGLESRVREIDLRTQAIVYKTKEG
jgi:cell division protein FtsQ